MRSASKWTIEIVVISIVLLGLSQAVSWGIARLTPDRPTPLTEQVLIALFLLLAGLFVELIRWAREAVDFASSQVSQILADRLADSAERAVRTAVLRSIFPNSDPDTVNSRIHFGVVEDYLRQVERRPPLIQRASGVLATRHLASWDDEMDRLTGRDGLVLKMDESAHMSAVMMEGGRRYLTIERIPCDPRRSWSPGFLKLINDLAARSSLEKTFILLANPAKLWGPAVPEVDRDGAKELFIRESDYLHGKGFSVLFCDERKVYMEFGTTDIPTYNFEVFSDQVVLMMDSAVAYDRGLAARIRPLSEASDLRRLLYVIEQHAERATPRIIRSGRFD